MSYVIQFEDGAYNRGNGFPVELLEATLYPSFEDAQDQVVNLTGAKVVPYPEPPKEALYTPNVKSELLHYAKKTLSSLLAEDDYFPLEYIEGKLDALLPMLLIAHGIPDHKLNPLLKKSLTSYRKAPPHEATIGYLRDFQETFGIDLGV